MRHAVILGNPHRERHLALTPRHIAISARAHVPDLGGQDQLRLPGSDQIDIDLRQKLGVEQRAVLGAAGIVDGITRAEIVKAVRHAGMFAPRQQQGIDEPLARNRRPLHAIQFGIDKADVE